VRAPGRIQVTNNDLRIATMNTISRLLLSTAAAFLLLANAHAGVMAVDVPRISNGGTGFIGVTESVGQPQRADMHGRWSHDGTSAIPTGAGEASTTVDGRPNIDPNAAALAAHGSMNADTRTMGASASTRDTASSSEPASYTMPAMGTPK
jgi:hypothetical protein